MRSTQRMVVACGENGTGGGGGAEMSDGETGELQPAQRESIVRHVHRELRRAILQNRLAAGSRLVETSLAERMNVSRTPVREAIQKLESEGLVRRLPQGGVVVEDTRSRHEVLVFRQALEATAIRLACTRAAAADIETLTAQAEVTLQAVPQLGRAERSAADRAFHRQLAQLSQSPRAWVLIEEFYDYSWSQIWLEIPEEIAFRSTIRLFSQHVEIARSLASRDPDMAERAIRRHLDTVQDTLNANLADQEPVG